jgi:urease accessory protein
VRTRIVAAGSAAVEWLPQETILFDRCALDRRLEVELAADSWFLGGESLVFGRAAMGESVAQASLRDVIRVRRAGRLLLHDTIRLEGDVAATMQRPGIAGGARAVAALVHVSPDAENALDALREALASHNPPLPLAGEVAERSEAGEGAARGKTLTRDAPASRPLPPGGRGVQCGATAWDGMLIARILAADGAELRTAVIAALRVLRAGRPLPRVWMC